MAFLGSFGLFAGAFTSRTHCDRLCRSRALKTMMLLIGLGLPAAGVGVGLQMSPKQCPSCQRPLRR